MQIARTREAGEFAALRDDWNRLANTQPFRSWEWLYTWWLHYAQSKAELFLLTAKDEAGHLCGLAPWFLEERAAGTRVIQFLGSGEVCTDHLTVLCAPGRQTDVVDAVSNWLVDQASGKTEASNRWDLLEFDCVADDNTAMHTLFEQLEEVFLGILIVLR